MTTKSMWTSLTGATALVALMCTSLVAADVRDRERSGYQAQTTPLPTASSVNVQQQTPESRTVLGGASQPPTVTIRMPGLAPPATATAQPGVGMPAPNAASPLPGLPTDPARSSAGATIPAQPAVTSAINPTVPRPVAPTAGINVVPNPTNGAAMQRGYPIDTRMPGATTVVTPGYGYNTGATAAYGYSPAALPVSPTALRALSGPSPAPGRVPAGGPTTGYAPASIQPNVGPAPTVVAEKPFSGYAPPPVYSPYMNLFRNDNDRGRINNYYSLVRPMQEQQRINYQTQNTLQSLQSTTRAQGSQLQQIDQRMQAPVPQSTNPSFMNYQNYYPGLAR